ncbi:hypothetical protein KJ966_11340 [bacterium]|nr:hypothetical protein [bacterium]
MENTNEVAFIGEVTAGVTHELKNVFATIKEMTGLMEDLFIMSKSDSSIFREQIEKQFSSINSQIGRGIDTLKQLNRFSHSLQYECVEIDLVQTLNTMIILYRHRARLNKVNILLAQSDEIICFSIQPIQFQRLLILVLECMISILSQGGNIKIQTEKLPESVLIQFSGLHELAETDSSHLNPNLTEQWQKIQLLARELGFKTDLNETKLEIVMELTLPE